MRMFAGLETPESYYKLKDELLEHEPEATKVDMKKMTSEIN